MRPDFDQALERYVEGCKAIHAAYKAKHFPNIAEEPWRVERLQKRARVVNGGGVHSFVDYETGNVLKPAGWKAPAKHARGNIFDAANGLGSMGPYGPAYLR